MLNAPLVRSAPSVAKGATLRASFWLRHISPCLPDRAPLTPWDSHIGTNYVNIKCGMHLMGELASF